MNDWLAVPGPARIDEWGGLWTDLRATLASVIFLGGLALLIW